MRWLILSNQSCPITTNVPYSLRWSLDLSIQFSALSSVNTLMSTELDNQQAKVHVVHHKCKRNMMHKGNSIQSSFAQRGVWTAITVEVPGQTPNQTFTRTKLCHMKMVSEPQSQLRYPVRHIQFETMLSYRAHLPRSRRTRCLTWGSLVNPPLKPKAYRLDT